jgi:hypothetical protein
MDSETRMDILLDLMKEEVDKMRESVDRITRKVTSLERVTKCLEDSDTKNEDIYFSNDGLKIVVGYMKDKIKEK